MRIWYFFIAVLIGLFFGFTSLAPNSVTPSKLLGQMYDSIKNIRTLRQKVFAIERIEKSYSNSISEIKVQTHPEKIYFKGLSKDLEILYNSEKPEDKALVKLHTFPFLMLNLDPRGNLMRKNQHYTIHELGYGFIGKSVALTISKDRDGIKNFTYRGKAAKNGYVCHLLEYENANYTYVDYTVREKETASSISYKLIVNDYLLRYKNDLLNDFGYLKKGSVLKVPTLYCKKAMVFLEEKMMLPVSLSLYDDMGLFESYDYTHIELNKPFLPKEFDRDFEAYDF